MPTERRPPRVYTPEEANALLSHIRPLVRQAREAMTEYRFQAEQMHDLESMWGTEIREDGNPGHREYVEHAGQAAKYRREAELVLGELTELGVELKDPLTGLVDFYGERDGELVYLCWREDEPAVAHWHSLTGGFAGRKPL